MKIDNDVKQRFYDGKLYDSYNYLGCQYNSKDNFANFMVYAPNAESVSLVGDFNNWDSYASIMENDGGFWSFSQNNVKANQSYKYLIKTRDGRLVYKSDPYAYHGETRGSTASKVTSLDDIPICNQKHIVSKQDIYKSPMNIYEAHIGSWRKYEDGNNFDYRKFADEISEYLKDMGYTHLELMGIAEYPFDGSWGYQVTGYYAPTSRYGSVADFAYLVEKLHANGIKIIMDWVPGHFPKDENGLIYFDGTPLYEPHGDLMSQHKEWGTMCFNYSSGAVKSFLISNAMFWFDRFHIDGLRVDAVASMLYLDYGRNEWTPNIHGGNENLDAIQFFKELNAAVFSKFPNALMVAEESTAFPLVTKPCDVGGLGFNFKWNMGWMNDTLKYYSKDPYFRGGQHNNMTFSLTYAFSENFILPISHDEVVYGKCSLLSKAPGLYDDKFANYRLYLMYMYSHPGKKLLFMGSEFAQFSEWDFTKELDWEILQYDKHKQAQDFCRKLNKIYLSQSALYELEDDWMGFEWLIADDHKQNVFAYERRNSKGDKVVVILNFSPMEYINYTIGLEKGTYKQLLYCDVNGYAPTSKSYKTDNVPSHNKSHSITIDIKPYCGMYLTFSKVKKGVKK